LVYNHPMKRSGYEYRVDTASLASDEHIRRNEDTCFASDEGYLGVFDGVGGNFGSELASQFVASYCLNALSRLPRIAAREASERDMGKLLEDARQALIDMSIKEHEGLISTTSVIARALADPSSHEPYIQFTHTGDSRGYLIRDNQVAAVTLDHGIAGPNAMLQELLSNAHYPDELPDDFRFIVGRRNLIMSAITSRPAECDMRVEYDTHTLMQGDVVLLTSDGVHDNLTDPEIIDIMRSGTVRDLVEAARTTSRRPNYEPHIVNGKKVQRLNFRPKADDITAASLRVF